MAIRLFQFPSKLVPVPADIVYLGDSADAFDEVNATIQALIGAYPNLLALGELTLNANQFAYVNNSSVLTAAAISALAISLLADTTTTAMQSTLGLGSAATQSSNFFLQTANNLSDLASAATARANLGLGALTNGQLAIGSTGLAPVLNTLTAGTNISITNSAGSITISATGSAGFSWNIVAGTSVSMVSNNGYQFNNAGLTTANLPAMSNIGDIISFAGVGAGGWIIQCGVGQNIIMGVASTTSGGTVASTYARDSGSIRCIVANTTWQFIDSPMAILNLS